MPVQFTQGQLRGAVGLSKETFRHWKRVLPAFSNRKGHSPSFSPGDVLASAILRHMTESCGVRIGHFAETSTNIFEICNTNTWAVLEDRVLVVDFFHGNCRLFQEPADIPLDNTIVVCPLTPVIHALPTDLLRSRPASEQGKLYFAPTQIGRGATARRRAE